MTEVSTEQNTEQKDIQHLSRAARKKLRRQERERQQQEKEVHFTAKAKKKKFMRWSVAGIAGLAAVGFFVFLFSTIEQTGPYSGGEVHWHADIRVLLCSIQQTMPAPPPNLHLGSPLLHTHDDKRIHVEGTIWKAEDITLGKYMREIGLVFTNERLLEKTNGDPCNGKPGKVKIFVNGEESQELAAYVIQDGDQYELRFE